MKPIRLSLLLLAALTTSLRAQDNVTLQNTTVGSGQTVNQSANVTIAVSNNYNVNSGGQVNLTAGYRITFDPTVDAAAGASSGGLHAMIDFNHNGISDWVEQSTGSSALPYFTSFEASSGFGLGNLNTQGGWFSGPGTVAVANGTAADGAWLIDLPATGITSSVTKYFLPVSGGPTTYVDFFIRPVFTGALNTSSYLDVGSAQLGFLQADSGGRLQVLTANSMGAAQWLTVGPSIPLNSVQQSSSWLRVTLRLNYTTRLCDAFLNGQLIASGLTLNSTDTSLPFFTLYGSTLVDTFFDDIYVGSSNPLPADTLAPTVPSTPAAYSTTSSSATISWAPSTGAIGVSAYNIYRNGTLVGTTSGLQTYYTDQNLSAGATYSYTVQAVNSGGVASAASSALGVTTASTTTPTNLEVANPLR